MAGSDGGNATLLATAIRRQPQAMCHFRAAAERYANAIEFRDPARGMTPIG